jgi:hypothetical protein
MQTINYRDCVLLENIGVSFWREYAEALNLDYNASLNDELKHCNPNSARREYFCELARCLDPKALHLYG